MEEYIFSRESQSCELKIMTMVTVIDSLPKSLLSGVVRKIRDLFPPTAGPLIFNGSLNFSLRIDLAGSDVEARN